MYNAGPVEARGNSINSDFGFCCWVRVQEVLKKIFALCDNKIGTQFCENATLANSLGTKTIVDCNNEFVLQIHYGEG